MGFLDILKPSTIKKGADVIFAKAMEHSTATTIIGSTIGLVGTIVLTYRVRPKVDMIIEERKEQIEEINSNPEMTEEEKSLERKKVTRSTIKDITIVGLPLIVSATATAGFNTVMAVATGKAISKWHEAAIVSDTMCQDLLKATKEEVGEEKMREIQEKAAQNRADRELAGKVLEGDYWPDGIVQAKGGSQVFYDAMTGRLFKSDERTITDSCLACTDRISSGRESYITLNEFYSEMYLPQVIGGDSFIWGGTGPTNSLKPIMFNTIKINDLSATILDWEVRPCISYGGGISCQRY